MMRALFGATVVVLLCLTVVVLPASAESPSVTLDPTSGTVGSTINVAGQAFPARSKGEVLFDGTRVARFRSDRAGTFTVRFTVPTRPDGTYTVTATTGGTSATAAFTLGTVSSEPPPDEEPPPSDDPDVGTNPFTNATFYVDPHSNARREAANDPGNAAIWNRIGDHAQADWFGDWYPTSDVRSAAAQRADTIRGVGALPVFVVYAIPQRDCGGYSSGGTNSPDDYRAWIAEFAAGIDGGPSAVILEPDALAQLDCLSDPTHRTTRVELIREAVTTLTAAGASVYLDAGNSAWIAASTMAERLRDAGVASARGFSLNVSNFRWTSDEIAYGTQVSDLVGGSPFVVDTSRNGLGPSTDEGDKEPWCNPDGRALGTPPTANTGDARVDAYLWIKRPGESDGTCKGGPPAGSWWQDYAFGLADRAPWAQ